MVLGRKWVRFPENEATGGADLSFAVDPLRTPTGGTSVQRGPRKRIRGKRFNGTEEEEGPLIGTCRPVGSGESSACARGRSLVIVWSEPSSQLGLLRKFRKPKK